MNTQNIINDGQSKNVTFFTRQRQEKGLDFKQNKRNLDSKKIPAEIEQLFPNKVRIFDRMRELEDNINLFMRQKLLTVKEDLL